MISTFALDSTVLQEGLCTTCGACQGLCPYWDCVKGRTITYFECQRQDGRCQRFCPRMPVDLKALMEKAFPGENIIPEIGPFRSLLLTRAADPDIRAGSQHGGTVTALMELALREGLIDSAVLTKSKNTLDPEGVLVTDPDKDRQCSESSFQIAPALAQLNRALADDRCHKIGVVGTPCKTLALYKMRYDPLPDNDNHAGNIGLILGLFCGWGLDWDGIRSLTEKYADAGSVTHADIPPSKYHSYEIRAGEKTVSVNLDEVTPLVRNACHYCADMTCEFSDLSVGGARSKDGWDVDKGWNQVIVRTKLGQDLIELAKAKGVLEFKEVPDTALDKIKSASSGKKRTAMRYLHEKYGSESLGYLQPSADWLKTITD